MFVAHNPHTEFGWLRAGKIGLEMMTRVRSTPDDMTLRKDQGLSHGMLRIQKQNGGNPMTCLVLY